MAKELASGFQEAETSSLVISAHTLLLHRLDAAAPLPKPSASEDSGKGDVAK